MNEQFAPNATTLRMDWKDISHLFTTVEGVASNTECEIDIDYDTHKLRIFQPKEERPIVDVKGSVQLLLELQAVYVEKYM